MMTFGHFVFKYATQIQEGQYTTHKKKIKPHSERSYDVTIADDDCFV